jgi:soluble lytic murein transglycosylase-like protein
VGAFILDNNSPRPAVLTSNANAAPAVLRAQITGAFAAFDEHTRKLARAQAIASFGHHYKITPKLARDIYGAAERAGVDPDLAYRLVKLESYFDEQATSPVGAIGLTQVMLSTAQIYDRNITAEQLYDRHTNLRIGLSYLREMLEQHDGNVMLALAAYNRGPGHIERLLAQGRTPNNAYERIIMRGYTGRGILE